MAHLDVIRQMRRKLATDGPPGVRAADDFATVTLPECDCDAIRDLLIAERPGTIKIGCLWQLGVGHRRGADLGRR
jgi:hypothetical protein